MTDPSVDRPRPLLYYVEMDSAPDIHVLAKEMAVMEQRMETLKAEQEGALDRLRADMANWKTDMAQRDKDNLRWSIGLWVAAVVIIGVLIRWPAS